MNKRGLSGVVTSLILILLVLVAVGIVWVVVKNIISEGSEQVSLGMFTVDLEIKNVKVNDDGSVDVKVERKVGQGELTGIKFIISDGTNSQVIEKDTNLQELGVSTFPISQSGLGDIAFVKEVSIAPILELDSGKEKIGNVADKFEFSNKDIIKNLGAVSWWRFEENANDEIGGNHGEEFGGINCNVEGKHGKACEFDGVDDYVDFQGGDVYSISNGITVVAWVKPTDVSGINVIVCKNGPFFLRVADGKINIGLYNGVWNWKIGNIDITENSWYHLSMTWNKNTDTAKLYVNGDFDISTTISSPIVNPEITKVRAGADTYLVGGTDLRWLFDGLIDEPMIFNRALSEEQVKALYELDLS